MRKPTMKWTNSGLPLSWLVALFLAVNTLPILGAARCPGNVDIVPLHLVKRYLFIVAVSIDHAGPYDFLLDTGTQTTDIDQALAGELHLNLQGTSIVGGIGFAAKASSARLDQLAAGSLAVANQVVLVYKFPAGGVLPAHASWARTSSNISTCSSIRITACFVLMSRERCAEA